MYLIFIFYFLETTDVSLKDLGDVTIHKNLSQQVYYPLAELLNYAASQSKKKIFIYSGLCKALLQNLNATPKVKDLTVPELQKILQAIKNLFAPEKEVRKTSTKFLHKCLVVHLYTVFRMLSAQPAVIIYYFLFFI